MKIKWLYILAVSCCLAGCSGTPEETETTHTQEKIDLLKSISVDEERIDEGKFYSWQEEILVQYDEALEYLSRKYPSYEFTITDCRPENKINNMNTTFWFTAEGVPEDYELCIGDSGYEDNFYGYLVKEDYEKSLLEILQKAVPETAAVSTVFNTVLGEKYDETLTPAEIMADSSGVTNSTEIFILEQDPVQAEKFFEEIKETLLHKGVYGSYHIIAVSSGPDSGKDFSEFVKNDQSVIVTDQRYNNFTHRLS